MGKSGERPRYGTDDEGEPSCGAADCANRWRCMLHVVTAADRSKHFRPDAELVIAKEKATLTCHDYWLASPGAGGGEED